MNEIHWLPKKKVRHALYVMADALLWLVALVSCAMLLAIPIAACIQGDYWVAWILVPSMLLLALIEYARD